MAETLPLKRWEVLTNSMYDWDDVKYILGVAGHYVRSISECFKDDATTMLTFKVRAA